MLISKKDVTSFFKELVLCFVLSKVVLSLVFCSAAIFYGMSRTMMIAIKASHTCAILLP